MKTTSRYGFDVISIEEKVDIKVAKASIGES
jgi:uroporphyrinogen-III decarboxylase